MDNETDKASKEQILQFMTTEHFTLQQIHGRRKPAGNALSQPAEMTRD